ncbi:MAG: 23S rRNA (adenine(1618)-N(6))-methyltransferase RlmF [Bacteroidota bacterium]|nr:23S rRNA (adenine(1618)-N(6))-methyltransferase RlmF [Odoribacter sp.]MDP3644313.1 23S rRNA (adenine(1618)-N(6))-methyltransferase RlmF [Bacteroidota bacterium]
MKEQFPATGKPGLHPRNPHRFRYDFKQLIGVCPELAPFVILNKYNTESVDFANAEAVKTLNKAILKLHYNLDYWDIPANYLCPPIPGRADYILHVADLLASGNKGIIPAGKSVSVLDIGVGANCIYPIIGNQTFGWHFVGSDIDPVAIRVAQKIIDSNISLKGKIELRLQTKASNIFSNILKPGEHFDLSVCNPPFHTSQEMASEGTIRKNRNLKMKVEKIPALNFGGQSNELWCDGGEAEFLRRMVKQSSELPYCCKWFSSLVSKKSNLPGIFKALQKSGAKEVRVIKMGHGQKQSRIVCWTFLSDKQQTQPRK